LQAVATHLAELMPEARRDFPGAEFVIELGRFLVGEAGVYVSRVIERKLSRGQVFLITDGGMHHHLAASGNFGQVIRKNYPVVVGNRVAQEGEAELASVVGPLCTPLDLLADKMPLGHAQEGDLIAVLQSGAYGLSASPTAFLSHPLPAEVLV
jgi:diaminopimelate decarboxylase